MDFLSLVRALRRQLVIVVSATLIGVAVGALTGMLTPPHYQASTQLMITVQAREGATPSELALGTNYTRQVIETYRSVITSSLVLQPVIDDLGLETSPSSIAAGVTTSTSLNSSVITVTVTDTNPAQAARLANAIGDSFTTVVSAQLEQRPADAAFQIRVVPLEPARVPLVPVAPNMRMSLLLGAVLGLGAGVGVAVLRTVLDTRIRTLSDLEQAVDAPVLGGIAFDPNAASRPLIVSSAPHDPRAEAFRSLRTNVRFLFPSTGPGVFVVTSSGPGEGKTTTASNLAIAFAESGYRVALVDADMRLPRVAERFGLEGGVGLSDVLVGRVAVTDAIQRWGRGTLFVLAAGTVPPNPAELLGSGAMESLAESLAAAFDVVIFDTPPALLVTDAAVISRVTTGVILVGAAEKSTKPRLSEAVKAIEAVDSRILGTVVTMLPISGADRTAYGTYAYGAHATAKG